MKRTSRWPSVLLCIACCFVMLLFLTSCRAEPAITSGEDTESESSKENLGLEERDRWLAEELADCQSYGVNSLEEYIDWGLSKDRAQGELLVTLFFEADAEAFAQWVQERPGVEIQHVREKRHFELLADESVLRDLYRELLTSREVVGCKTYLNLYVYPTG